MICIAVANKPITYFNRYTQREETELVYGDGAIKFIYDNPMGRMLAPLAASKPVSQLYGCYQDWSVSGNKVAPFVEKFDIDLSMYKAGSVESESKENSYKNFNEFFIREFEDGQRPFVDAANKMPAFSEARYFGHQAVSGEVKVPVKGEHLSAKDLLGGSRWSDTFTGGPLLIARLCPVDYHRYHYPLDGETLDSFPIPGRYHSVNPLALKSKPDIFIVNERRASILETQHFGKLVYIEVGAAMVGKIVQSHNESTPHKQGDEKGYFLFGGSTVILLGEPGKWRPSQDILKYTQAGIETYLHLGDAVAELCEQ
ncbi:MAG: phosphatidylserine decarboxylase [Gammaproteobacteria bacterium]|nr:phosphatidylserine decarboxylase [Gammaproteobacteria bacterium]